MKKPPPAKKPKALPTRSPRHARRRLLAALYPREKWGPDEWAERCRVLGEDESSEPGRYSFGRTPYWRFVAKLSVRPGVEEIVVLKGHQIGWSEHCRNMVGYWVDLDPGPILILTPDQKSTDNFKIERLEPLIRHTPALAKRLGARARDETKYRIKFDSCSVFLAWAGSKTGTKSRPIRRLICEEPDEFPAFSGRGGDPLVKALKRTRTYSDKGRATVLIGGTPTTRLGNIWKRWELSAVRYHSWLPCPHCGGYQELLWKQVKWPDLKSEIPDRSKRAEKIERDGLAYYECEHCQGKILDHHKPAMLLAGVWATEDQVVGRDGEVKGPAPASKRVGVKISGLYSPWSSWGTIVKDWLESQGDPEALCDFVNQWLAEPFEEQRAKTEPEIISAKAAAASPPMVVPRWALALIATADTQGQTESDGYFWYVIRAWGLGYRSQLVDFGIASSKQELRERCLARGIPIEGANKLVAAQILLTDSGGPRFGEIYEMAQADQRIHPTKGMSTRRAWMVEERLQKKHGIILWEIDTEQAKDLLHRLIHDPDRTRWMPHDAVTPDYCSQMCAEAKVYDPILHQERWIEIAKNHNHLWDCEALQAAAAWRVGCGAPEPTPDAVEPQAAASKRRNEPDRPDWMPAPPEKYT